MSLELLEKRIARLENIVGRTDSNVSIPQKIKSIQAALSTLSLENKPIKDFLKKYKQLLTNYPLIHEDTNELEDVELLKVKAEIIMLKQDDLIKVTQLLKKIDQLKGFTELPDAESYSRLKKEFLGLTCLHQYQLDETKKLANELMQISLKYFYMNQLVTKFMVDFNKKK